MPPRRQPHHVKACGGCRATGAGVVLVETLCKSVVGCWCDVVGVVR
jgi:hypothetical protein